MELLTSAYGTSVARRAQLVAVLAEPEDLSPARLRGLTGVADALEVRADLVGDPIRTGCAGTSEGP
ncbi:hypothetical protein O1L55_42365 [Streptomyces albulus]|nr:hypothetical protein [Streptomyces noursei]